MTNLPKLTQEEFERRVKWIEADQELTVRDILNPNNGWDDDVQNFWEGYERGLAGALRILTRKPRRKK